MIGGLIDELRKMMPQGVRLISCSSRSDLEEEMLEKVR
jgi:hypothetical protein